VPPAFRSLAACLETLSLRLAEGRTWVDRLGCMIALEKTFRAVTEAKEEVEPLLAASLAANLAKQVSKQHTETVISGVIQAIPFHVSAPANAAGAEALVALFFATGSLREFYDPYVHPALLFLLGSNDRTMVRSAGKCVNELLARKNAVLEGRLKQVVAQLCLQTYHPDDAVRSEAQAAWREVVGKAWAGDEPALLASLAGSLYAEVRAQARASAGRTQTAARQCAFAAAHSLLKVPAVATVVLSQEVDAGADSLLGTILDVCDGDRARTGECRAGALLSLASYVSAAGNQQAAVVALSAQVVATALAGPPKDRPVLKAAFQAALALLKATCSPDTLYPLTVPLLVHTHSRDLFATFQPLSAALVGLLPAAFGRASQWLRHVISDLENENSLNPDLNPDEQGRRAVARVLRSLGGIALAGGFCNLSLTETGSLLRLLGDGLRRPENRRAESIGVDCLVFLLALSRLPSGTKAHISHASHRTTLAALLRHFLAAFCFGDTGRLLDRDVPLSRQDLEQRATQAQAQARAAAAAAAAVEAEPDKNDPLSAASWPECLFADFPDCPAAGSRPGPTDLLRCLVVTDILVSLLPCCEEEVVGAFVKALVRVVRGAVAADPGVYGSLAVRVLARLGEASVGAETLDVLRGAYDRVFSEVDESEEMTAQSSVRALLAHAAASAELWRSAPMQQRFNVVDSVLRNVRSGDVHAEAVPDVRHATVTLLDRTGEVSVPERRLKGHLVMLLASLRVASATDLLFGAYAHVYSTARRSTDVFERDDDQADRYHQWVLAATEHHSVQVLEYSPWYVEHRVFEAVDEFWSGLDAQGRLRAVSEISVSLQGRGMVTGTESLRLAAELRLLARSLSQPHTPPEMAFLLLSSVFAEVVAIRDSKECSEHYVAACEALVAVTARVPGGPSDFFDQLLDVASQDWHREMDGGRCSALLLQACALLVRDTRVKVPRGADLPDTPHIGRLLVTAAKLHTDPHTRPHVKVLVEQVATSVAESIHSQRSTKNPQRDAMRILQRFAVDID
jgi:hypothetical protein